MPEREPPDRGTATASGVDTGGRDAEAGAPQRLRAALVRPSRAQLIVAVLLAVLGFATVVQVRSTEVDDTYAGYREQDLIDILNGLAGATQRAESEISRLEEARDELQSDTNAARAALQQATQQADTLAILAGLVPVTGPGIRVTVTETEAAVSMRSVLDMVQELRTAGAEAMQFNGQVRVVAQTAFEDAPGGLLVDGVLLSPPYVIDVIGAPDALAGAMAFPGGPTSQFEDDGAVVEVEELESLDIESVREATQPEYAEPATAQ